MRVRITDKDRAPQQLEPAVGGAGSGAGQAAAEFLAAADEAIARALSGDAEGFLRANKQKGGE